MKGKMFALLSLLALACWPQWTLGQSYPKQAITLIVPLAPGDATDVAGRTIGEGLSKLLKVPVVAVNKPGAGGTDHLQPLILTLLTLMAATALVIAPVVILFLLTQRTFIQGIATTGMKG